MRRSTAPSLRQACRVPQVQEVDSNTRPGAGLVRNAVRDTRSVLGLLNVARGVSTEAEPTSSEDVSQPARQGDANFSNRVFTVVWGKPSRRKHRTWEGDGTLHVSHNSAVLKDADGKELGRLSRVNTAVLEAGSRLSVGGREVELVEVASAGPQPASPAASPPAKRRSQQLPIHRPLVMPLPSQEHQWQHNPSHRPLAVVSVDWRLCRVLRPHQRDGVVFLYECVTGMRRLGHYGAVLADEMGLGKTLQTITLAWTLLKQGPYGRAEVRRVLVVTPSSLVANWQREFQRWLPLPQPIAFAIDQKHKPEEFAKLPHVPVMIISYERFVRSYEEVTGIQFDLLVCDEAHRLKNFSVRASILLSQLPCQRRILLTGTPIQNHLQEFYTIVNFVNPGVLGSTSEFQQQFERVITAGRQPQASTEVRALGEERAAELGRLTSWFILRRSQDVVRRYLLEKHEAVLFCAPSCLQRKLYGQVVQLWGQRMEDGPAPLEVITMLRKVCNHPCLLRVSSNQDSSQWQEKLWQRVEPVLAAVQRVDKEQHSGKLQVLVGLMQDLHQAGEKLVLVSGYTQTLDLLASICEREQLRFCRLDGSTPSDQRLQIVESFNIPSSRYSVFLLSARAGGEGLNLTGASRLVLYDCDWNPATDRQAMARIWRDGQARPVHLYRFLTTGTIEEKMFQRQMSKTGLREAVVEPSNPGTVRLSDKELKDLFSLATGPCSTHTLLGCDCEGQGLPAVPSSTSDSRDCQLGAELVPQVPGIDQLGCWQHLAPPFPAALLQEMALTSVAEHLTFIFRSSSEEL